MTVQAELQSSLELEENRTVGDSFGGESLGGRSPDFRIAGVTEAFLGSIEPFSDDPVAELADQLSAVLDASELKYVINAAIRHSFIIELTNLKITSTKMKTRWVPGRIIKTNPGTFTNFEGNFALGDDQRSADFNTCCEVFKTILELLLASEEHISVVKKLTTPANRRIPYEFVFTYADCTLNPVHAPGNIRLVNLDDIGWLIKGRTIIRKALPTTTANKIKTKAYLTDRVQTGTDQTNRAKRWEVLDSDFQHATIEECWSVERKLLADLAHFCEFPIEVKTALVDAGLFGDNADITRCPVTLETLNYQKFIQGSDHGEAEFQVGHLKPLKTGGSHSGSNVAWITADGNRLQGDLEMADVRKLLRNITRRMDDLGIE